jgi:hypothetical protein
MMSRMYTGAAICRRGHYVSWDIAQESSDYCAKCGASVLTRCESCDTLFKGVEVDPSVVFVSTTRTPPPRFCEGCGSPFPWVDRQGRIYELQNMLEREQLDPATALTVREQLEALLDDDLSEEEQRKRWERVRRLAPGLWERGQNILESVVSATLKHELGL